MLKIPFKKAAKSCPLCMALSGHLKMALELGSGENHCWVWRGGLHLAARVPRLRPAPPWGGGMGGWTPWGRVFLSNTHGISVKAVKQQLNEGGQQKANTVFEMRRDWGGRSSSGCCPHREGPRCCPQSTKIQSRKQRTVQRATDFSLHLKNSSTLLVLHFAAVFYIKLIHFFKGVCRTHNYNDQALAAGRREETGLLWTLTATGGNSGHGASC